jgi:hypothetical protein
MLMSAKMNFAIPMEAGILGVVRDAGAGTLCSSPNLRVASSYSARFVIHFLNQGISLGGCPSSFPTLSVCPGSRANSSAAPNFFTKFIDKFVSFSVINFNYFKKPADTWRILK